MPDENREIGSLIPAVMFLVLTAVAGGLGVIILGEFILDQTTSTPIINESTLNCSSASGGTPDIGWLNANSTENTTFLSPFILDTIDIQNTTNHSVSLDGAFGIDRTDGSIDNCTLSRVTGNSTYLITYTYNIKAGSDGSAYDIFELGVEGIQEIAGWLDIIALVISATIILAIILSVITYLQQDRGNKGGDFYQ